MTYLGLLYDEAKLVAEFVVELRPEWKEQVRYLVR